ncbi:BTB_2 domain-containing protein [Meloidogyne graminicola]|uniref:BTB_2 domain-containing protein n=1 Tax=Meloidogyne graminicola TaxID=189291 RepID=A0A8S9ZYD9_9BILA|nr:BTB_2 domain-containing protein [Meloidogyne graminicola]
MENINNSLRIIFNVGGKCFETSRQTIKRIPDTRNGYIVNDDNDGDELFEMLEKEAQYFGISEMANLCRSMQEPLSIKTHVRWRKDAIPHYWKLFLKCVIDRSLTIPFTYERNSFFYAKCIACEADFDPKCSNIYSFSVDDWSALGHHMVQMCGRVEKV